MRIRSVLAAVVFALPVVGVGCLSPTLPLPPPEAPEAIRETSAGVWSVVGDCSPGAFVTVFVERAGVGAVVEDRDANGRYSVEVKADRCAVVSIWQTDGEETSAKQRAVLQPLENGQPIDAEECAR
jgi:hypothetical protein